MKKETYYKYLGTNGVITSPVHLEDIYYIRLLHLIADDNKKVTKDGKFFFKEVTIPEEELDQWSEVNA